MTEEVADMLPRWLVAIIVAVSAGVWTTNIAVGWIEPGREIEGVNTVFAAIFSGALALYSPGVRKVAQKISDALSDKED